MAMQTVDSTPTEYLLVYHPGGFEEYDAANLMGWQEITGERQMFKTKTGATVGVISRVAHIKGLRGIKRVYVSAGCLRDGPRDDFPDLDAMVRQGDVSEVIYLSQKPLSEADAAYLNAVW